MITVFQNSGLSAHPIGRISRFSAARTGVFAPSAHRWRLCRCQQAESVYVIRQIPQSNLGRRPRQADDPQDQAAGSLCLHPEDMFDPTAHLRAGMVAAFFTLGQFLMTATLSLKMLPKTFLFQRIQRLLRPMHRIRPDVTADNETESKCVA